MDHNQMSNYSAPTHHPVTGEIKMADWLDDSFGHHVYGVRFHGEEKIYHTKDCVEIGERGLFDEIERLRAALRVIEAMKWFARPCEIARDALAGGKTND
jgi:hypothetical protein